MTHLVLGGAGFIGSHLCERLLLNGHEVICVDNLSTGSFDNIKGLCSDARFTYLQQDVCDAIEADASVIFNLACPASPKEYQKTPTRTTKTAVMGAINCLELATKTGATIFQASTSEVYGDAKEHPQTESYWGNVNPIGERSCYDEAKRYSEALCMAYNREYSTNVGIARIFNTYGPRLSAGDGRVVSNFITQAIEGKPLSIYGDGLQTRSFCFVDDLVRGILALLDSSEVGPINIGSTDECSMLQLAETILELTRSASILDFQPKPLDDPTQRRPNIDLAKNILGWEPTVSLRDGLEKTIHFFKSA